MTEMPLIAKLHFLVGILAVVAGFAAFSLKKGTQRHRIAGRIFAFCMLALCASGLYLSLVRSIVFTIYLTVLAFHAVATGWLTLAVQGLNQRRAVLAGLVLIGLTAGASLATGIWLSGRSEPLLDGLPPTAFYIMCGICTLVAGFDLSAVLRSPLAGRSRIARHGWRMGFGLLIATTIFFLGNNSVLPEPLRAPILLSVPILAVPVLTALTLARLWRDRRVASRASERVKPT